MNNYKIEIIRYYSSKDITYYYGKSIQAVQEWLDKMDDEVARFRTINIILEGVLVSTKSKRGEAPICVWF